MLLASFLFGLSHLTTNPAQAEIPYGTFLLKSNSTTARLEPKLGRFGFLTSVDGWVLVHKDGIAWLDPVRNIVRPIQAFGVSKPDQMPSTIDVAKAPGRLIIGADTYGFWQIAGHAIRARRLTGFSVPRDAYGLAGSVSVHGSMIVSLVRGGLFSLPDGSDHARKIAGIPQDALVNCLSHAGNSSWVGTETDGLWRVDDGAYQAVHLPTPTRGIVSFCSYPAGLLIATVSEAFGSSPTLGPAPRECRGQTARLCFLPVRTSGKEC